LLKSDYSIYLLLFIIPFSAGITYLYYRKVIITKSLKYLLSGLRFLFLTSLLFLFLNPVIKYIRESGYKPVNIFLIDVSASLDVSGRDSIIKNIILPNLPPPSGENKYLLFSEDLLGEFNGDIKGVLYGKTGNMKTDIGRTLSSLNNLYSPDDISSITIISDGIFNSGENEILSAGILNSKINYILAGDTADFKDRSITGINYNKISYTKSFPVVTVNIFSKGIPGKIDVKLFEENTLIESKEINAVSNLFDYEVTFYLPNAIEGVHKYTVEITSSNNELTLKNNKEIFYIKRVNITPEVLVLSGGPDADYAFFTEEIKKLKNINVKFLTQKSPETFYEGDLSDLSKFNCLIFFGYPGRLTSEKEISLLKTKLEKNTPLIFFNSVTSDFEKLKIFEDFLSFKIESSSTGYSESVIRFISNADERFSFLKGIENFPPLLAESGNLRFRPDSEILIVSSGGVPVYGIRNSNIKSSGFTAYGLHKWKLNKGNYDYEKAFSGIITETINLLLEPKRNSPLNVETSKPVYSISEPVRFYAEVRDEYIIPGKKVSVRISGSGGNYLLETAENAPGKFSGLSDKMQEGDYSYEADYEAAGNEILRDKGRFTVGEDKFEYRYLYPEERLLKEFAALKGGKNLTGMSSKEMSDYFTSEAAGEMKKYKYEDLFDFGKNIYYLLFIVFLISLEWFIRKKYNLP